VGDVERDGGKNTTRTGNFVAEFWPWGGTKKLTEGAFQGKGLKNDPRNAFGSSKRVLVWRGEPLTLGGKPDKGKKESFHDLQKGPCTYGTRRDYLS